MLTLASRADSVLPVRYIASVVIAGVLLLVMPAGIWQLKLYSLRVVEEERSTLKENALWRRYVDDLSNAPLSEYLSNEDSEVFEVNLREVALALQQIPAIQLDSFIVSDSDHIDVDDDLTEPVSVLQVKFEATLNHTPALLDVLNQLFKASQWRVTDVRGCALQRLASTPRLAAACSLDIYHWTWSNTPDKEAVSF